jgi:hypothetical protein
MSNIDLILQAFQMYGYKITLGQALQHKWGYKFASRLSDLRDQGYKIDCIKGKTPSENLYVMQPPPDENGQLRMVI